MTGNRTTELLRELLDERGVEWRKWTKGGKKGFSNCETKWFVPYERIGHNEPGGFFASAHEHKDGLLHLKSMMVSPEQAVAATLGSGTCAFAKPTDLTDGCAALERIAELEAELGSGECELTMDGTDGCFGCPECLDNIPPLANYCPRCGAKVVAR